MHNHAAPGHNQRLRKSDSPDYATCQQEYLTNMTKTGIRSGGTDSSDDMQGALCTVILFFSGNRKATTT